MKYLGLLILFFISGNCSTKKKYTKLSGSFHELVLQLKEKKSDKDFAETYLKDAFDFYHQADQYRKSTLELES